MSTQAGAALKGRNRPTRQAAAQHRYADMKVETNGYIYEEQVIIRDCILGNAEAVRVLDKPSHIS